MDITTILLQIDLFSKQLESAVLTSIERDLIKSKLLSLYEKISLSNSVQTPIAPIIEQSVPPIVEIQKVEEVTLRIEEIVVTKIEETVSASEITVESIIEPAVVLVAEPEVEKVAAQEIPIPTIPSSLVDRLSESDNSLMGKFTATSKGLNDNVTEGDLKKLIDFNRQFVFIQELFGNDPKAYMEAINRLNAMQTIDEAVLYINQELVTKYNWNKDLQSLKLFDKIIRQKFGI